MAQYGRQFKESVAERLLPRRRSTVVEVSNKVGILATVAYIQRRR